MNELLIAASSKNYIDIVKLLIAAGANVNQAKTTNGASPLFIASGNGDVDLVKVLIQVPDRRKV